jgi:predicted nucleotide-binding protein
MATTKSRSNEFQGIPDALIISRSEFKGKLIERIGKGNDLVNISVQNNSELEKNESEYYKWDAYNAEFLKQSFNNEQNEYKRHYDSVNMYSGLLGGYDTDPHEGINRLKSDIRSKVEFLDRLLDKVELLKSNVKENETQIIHPQNHINSDNGNIFIVHGHNSAVKESVARTITKLGLNPIILHEQPNAGNTIIEKFEANSKVAFAIILLTDDDEGRSKEEKDLKARARQNVILEWGYFIGKLGRKRVLSLYSEGVELPSDIHGLLYISIDKAENWKFLLVRELKAASYSVDANSLM